MISPLLIEVVEKIKKSQEKNAELRKRFLQGEEKEVVSEIENEFRNDTIDLEVVRSFIDLVSMSNSSDILKIYSLGDLDFFLSNLCNLYPEDIDLNLEYYYFLFNIYDEEKRANEHLRNFSNYVTKKVGEIKST